MPNGSGRGISAKVIMFWGAKGEGHQPRGKKRRKEQKALQGVRAVPPPKNNRQI